ncbi:MAG: PQQ-binding-like beta-propeller repeat protein [Pirellulales bacterium]
MIGSASWADDWPQWLGPQRDGVWRESGLLDKFPDGGPKVLWRKPLGIGYAGPAVAGGRVFVMDLERELDENGQPRRATRQGIPGSERVLCLEAASGNVVWSHEYDCPYTISYPSGPRTTPVIDEGRVYALGAMGDLLCLDAADGKVHWSKKLTSAYNTEPPVWGYASHLLVDGDRLYTLAGGQGSAVVALDKHTGEEIWHALSSEEVGYSPPMIHELAGKRQLVIWLSEAIYGLDPATGTEYWKTEYPQGVPPQRPSVNIMTVKPVDDLVFISTFYHGPMMLRVDEAGASLVWKGNSNNPVKPDGAHCLMASPVFAGGHGYACGSNGEYVCFDQATGEKRWESYEPIVGKKVDCGAVFVIPQGERNVMFNDQGELILARLTPDGYEEHDRAKILEPVSFARGRDVVWSHPAFAQRCVFARNDEEMVCVSLAVEAG